MPGHDLFHVPTGHEGPFDLMLAVDVSDSARMGTCAALMDRSAKTAQMDHHPTNPGFADVNLVDGEAPANCMIIRELMKLPEAPTCVLCPDDYSCLGALWLLEAQGIRVPKDISLVGYDGIRMSQMMQPRLTTYRQDTAQIAREVFSLIIDAVEHPDTHIPQQITVSGMLMEGDTVG